MYHTNRPRIYIMSHLNNEVNPTFNGFKELLRSYNKNHRGIKYQKFILKQ